MKNNNNTIFWIIGIAIVVFIIIPKLQVPLEPLNIEVEYYKNGQKVSGLFSAFIVYDQIKFNIYASNTGQLKLSDFLLVNASPQILKDNLPLKSFETLEIGERNKLILSSNLIDVDYFAVMSQPVEFWVNVSAKDELNNIISEETTFQLTFEPSFGEMIPHELQSRKKILGTGITTLIDIAGPGYLTGSFINTEYYTIRCSYYIDGLKFITIQSREMEGDPVVDIQYISTDTIVKFENSLKIECDIPLHSTDTWADYTLSYMTPEICYPDCASLGKECGTWDDACGGILECGSCTSGYSCSAGQCVEGLVEGTYISSWSLSGPLTQVLIPTLSYYPYKITTDGNYIWVVGGAESIYKYTMSGIYVEGSKVDISSQGTRVEGITTDGNYIWTIDYVNDRVYKYNMDGTYTGTSWVTLSPYGGITTDGNYIWVLDLSMIVHKYTMSGTSLDIPFLVLGREEITTDGNYIWVLDKINLLVYKYNMDGTLINSWSTPTAQIGISTSGNYIWTWDSSNKKLYKYYK